METNFSSPNEDLQAIREIMERSSKFLSLSGLSGVFAGICALIGAAVAWFLVLDSGHVPYSEYMHGSGNWTMTGIRLYLALDAMLVLGFAVLGAVFFSQRNARKFRTPVLDSFNQAINHPFVDSSGIGRNFYSDFDISEQFDADCIRNAHFLWFVAGKCREVYFWGDPLPGTDTNCFRHFCGYFRSSLSAFLDNWFWLDAYRLRECDVLPSRTVR